MSKANLLRMAGAVALLAALPQAAQAATAQKTMSSAPAASLPIGHCINMGGMLDSDDWGGKKLDAGDFTRIRAAGFDTVRLTTNWVNHASDAAPYTIDPAWMARVTDMVDAALANNLNVVLNSHYFPALDADPLGNAPRLAGLWKQIAANFANRPNSRLFFELFNEPHDAFTPAVQAQVVGPALAAVRATNPKRPVIVSGGPWANVDTLATLNLPNDPNVWPTFHYYDPMDFTHQGADWVSPAFPLGRTYGTYWDQQALINDPPKVTAFAKRTGKMPFIGENGAYDVIPDPQRAEYHKAVYQAFTKVGAKVCVWAYSNTFPFWDYDTGKWHPGLLSAIGLKEQP